MYLLLNNILSAIADADINIDTSLLIDDSWQNPVPV